MNSLEDIPVVVESCATPVATVGNALPILNEISHALRRLLDHDEATVIDLRAIPFGPGDEERLFSALGEGEVVAILNALGETRVTETGYPGVWVVDHRNTEDEPIALQIEITRMPAILHSREEDISEGLERLAGTLLAEGELPN